MTTRFNTLKSILPCIPAGTRPPRIPPVLLEKIEYVFLFLLFLGCSTPYRVDTGNVSIGLTEVSAWIYILWRWVVGGQAEEKTKHDFRWMIWGLRAIAVWAGILWFASGNWEMRRETFLDWVLASLVFSCLLRSPVKDAKRLALLFVMAALPNALAGAFQHLQGIGLAPKDLSGWQEDATGLPVYGFFGHSNDLAVYLFWPFLVCTGSIFTGRRGWRVIFFALSVLYGAVLYRTISRSTLFTLCAAAAVLAVLFLLRRRKTFLLTLTAGLSAGAIALAGFLSSFPTDRIDAFLSGRLELWNRAWQIISHGELFLPIGFLSVSPLGSRVFWIPHNIYLLSWLQFGWPGVLLLAGWCLFFLRNGWVRYGKLHYHPVAAFLWIGLAGLFLVNGMASLYFHETYVILNFICVSALWAALLCEMDRTPPPQAAVPAVGKQPPQPQQAA